ncbi:MAG: hypothetical protein ABSF53_19080, partial [Terracidiphilus sp.]
MNHLSVTKIGQFCLAFSLTIATGFVGLQAQVSTDSNPSATNVPDKALDPAEAQARQAWRQTMHTLPTPAAGCFHATFPDTQWEEVGCEEPSGYRSGLPMGVNQLTAGNGRDYVAQAPTGHYFSSVLGGFPETKDVKSEKTIGVAAYHDGGVLGPNEYTLQLNTNFYKNSAACDGYSWCLSWQQYIVTSNYGPLTGGPTGNSAVFIESWLLNYGVHDGYNICPAGWLDGGADWRGQGDDCVQNSPT